MTAFRARWSRLSTAAKVSIVVNAMLMLVMGVVIGVVLNRL